MVLSSDRLEVSVDGLTLSPNAEVPHCEARPGQGEPAAGRSRAGPGSPGQAEAGGEAAGEEAALSPERRWGFALEELYGLALRFFKGEAARRRGSQTPPPPQPSAAGTGVARREPPRPGKPRAPSASSPRRAPGRRRIPGSPESRGVGWGGGAGTARGPRGGSVCRGEHRVTAVGGGSWGRGFPGARGEPRQRTGEEPAGCPGPWCAHCAGPGRHF